MEDFYDDYRPEDKEYLLSGPEEDEPAPEPEVPAEEPEEPEPAEPELPEESASGAEPGEGGQLPGEAGSGGDAAMQDLITAIGDLNETITGAVTEAEDPPGGEEGGTDGNLPPVEREGVDLTPVVQVLERTNALLEVQGEALATQHNDLLQLQANVDFVFLAVAALIGVVLGAAVGKLFHDLWRA